MERREKEDARRGGGAPPLSSRSTPGDEGPNVGGGGPWRQIGITTAGMERSRMGDVTVPNEKGRISARSADDEGARRGARG